MFVYLETAPRSGLFKRRGAAGPGDNPPGFARKMAAHGLRCYGADDDLGGEVKLSVLATMAKPLDGEG